MKVKEDSGAGSNFRNFTMNINKAVFLTGLRLTVISASRIQGHKRAPLLPIPEVEAPFQGLSHLHHRGLSYPP